MNIKKKDTFPGRSLNGVVVECPKPITPETYRNTFVQDIKCK